MRFDAATAKKYEDKMVPSETSLSVVRTWVVKTKQWAWTVVCHCGNAYLLLVGDYAARCHDCGEYHSRDAVQRASEIARKKATFDEKPLLKTDLQNQKTKQSPPMIFDSNGRVKHLTKKMQKVYERCLPLVKIHPTGSVIPHKIKVPLILPQGEIKI